MTQPENQMGIALKSAIDQGLKTTADPAATAAPTETEVVVAKAAAPRTPYKTTATMVKAPTKTVAPKPAVKTSAAPAKPDQLDVGSVIAQAAVGSNTKVKGPTISLPTFLIKREPEGGTDVESETAAKSDQFTLEIFGTGCLTCRALVDDEDLQPLETLPDCHFVRGFSLCPAGAIRIRAIGEQRMTARKLVKARESGDVLRFTRLMSSLSKRDVDFQIEVLETAGISIGSLMGGATAAGEETLGS